MKDTGTLKLTTGGDREMVMTRVFDARRTLVFDAFTRPELVKQWLLGPPGWSMPVCEIDLRVGGAYRYVWRHSSGKEMGMGGVYREIVPQERLIYAELSTTILYVSSEARDAVLKSGMERGVAASYDRLVGLLASLATPVTEKGASPS